VQDACGNAAILGGAAPRYEDRGVPVLADVVPESGPLGGLVTAFERTDAELAVLLAVDVPFAPPALLRYLIAAAEDADAAVPVLGGTPHPLCAVYRRTCGAPARRRLEAGQLKMTSFWPDVRVRAVGEAELAAFGDAAVLLRNLNTVNDYEGWRPSTA
jgi:molybdopterin-guanine dinucleotide biosynthesis protein A